MTPKTGAIAVYAEGVGFEPTFPFREPVFETGALNHSATPPLFILDQLLECFSTFIRFNCTLSQPCLPFSRK